MENDVGLPSGLSLAHFERSCEFASRVESARAWLLVYNLQRAGAEFVGDLIEYSKVDLLAVRNIGRTTVKYIEDALAEGGLRLGSGNEVWRGLSPAQKAHYSAVLEARKWLATAR